MIETCYVMEDGSVAHPRDVKRDANGILRHKDGRVVAMRGDVPRSRSVDFSEIKSDAVKSKDEQKAAPKLDTPPKPQSKAPEPRFSLKEPESRELKPVEAASSYKTRESKAD